MTDSSMWATSSGPKRAMLVLAMIALAWGPGIVVGVILWIATGHAYAGVLAFAVLCLLMSIVAGAIAAKRQKKREQASG